MNNKILIGLIVVLLILVGVVASQKRSEEAPDESVNKEENEETALVNVNGVVASARDSDMTGVWQSKEDLSYVLEFASEGMLREYYARVLTGTGSWSVEAGILTTNVNDVVQRYNVSSLGGDSMTIEYHGSSEVLEFSKVAL